MRENLEAASQSLSNLEVKASVIEERLQEIDGILKETQASISQADVRGDDEISLALQKNLSHKQAEYARQEESKKQITLQLNQIGNEIMQLQTKNNRSREEIEQLSALDEDVSAGTALIQERQIVLQSLEQRYLTLLARLDQISPIADVHFTDKSGHLITIRTWENGKHVMVRAYDRNQVQVPETVNLGQAGHAEASLEEFRDGEVRLRLTYIETFSDYRRAGIGGQLLNQVERFGHKHGAHLIYGSIENQDAQNYWHDQVNRGWIIDHNKGVYGEVSKRLK